MTTVYSGEEDIYEPSDLGWESKDDCYFNEDVIPSDELDLLMEDVGE